MRGEANVLNLYAAGSLDTAITDVAAAYERRSGERIAVTTGPSGLLRERIARGAPAHIFAAANMAHPAALAATRKTGPVVRFARNHLCVLAQGDMEITSRSALDVLLDPAVTLGTSTPKSDPAGDYAWAMFAKADAHHPGARAILEAKARMLTGGAESPRPPASRNPYGWLMARHEADLFLTYRTNAFLARAEVASLKIVELPPELAIVADYGLVVLQNAPAGVDAFVRFILSTVGQDILARYGFEALTASDRPRVAAGP